MIRKNPWSSLRMQGCEDGCGIDVYVLTAVLSSPLASREACTRTHLSWETSERERDRQTQRQKKIQKSKSDNRSTTTEIKASVSARHILGLYLPAFGADQACLSATSTKMHQLTGNSFITIIITNNSRTNPPTILSTEVIRIGGSPKN